MRKRAYQYVLPVPSARENDHRLALEALHGAADAWDALYEEGYPFVLREVKRFDDQHFFAFHKQISLYHTRSLSARIIFIAMRGGGLYNWENAKTAPEGSERAERNT